MNTYRVFLGLGSNLGERQVFLQRAVDSLRSVPAIKIIWSSSVYETDPYGKTDQPRFLNAVLEVETSLPPDALFRHTKQIEQQIGRTSSERWGPREIDIDLLLYDGLVFTDGSVTVPHPELPRRKFVLIPLRELAPDLVHPVSGLTVEELASECTGKGRVVKSTYRIVT
jgi:2-amino-4-hydroxy-6-hydroxymethyldihydropteridine diphosphokinase